MSGMELGFYERYGVTALPLEPRAILKRERIPVVDYPEYARKVGWPVEKLIEHYGRDAFTQCLDGRYLICCNSCLPRQRIRWTLTHELCHIYLGHMEADSQAGDGADQEVDRLVSGALCPMPVVHLCGVASQSELAALCGLSNEAAGYQFDRLQRLRAQRSVLRTREDVQLVSRFLPFISGYISEKLTGRTGIDLWNYGGDTND